MKEVNIVKYHLSNKPWKVCIHSIVPMVLVTEKASFIGPSMRALLDTSIFVILQIPGNRIYYTNLCIVLPITTKLMFFIWLTWLWWAWWWLLSFSNTYGYVSTARTFPSLHSKLRKRHLRPHDSSSWCKVILLLKICLSANQYRLKEHPLIVLKKLRTEYS